MAGKLLTTQRKKYIITAGVALSSWLAITVGGNPFDLPSLPQFLTTPIFGSISPMFLAGVAGAFAILTVWRDY